MKCGEVMTRDPDCCLVGDSVQMAARLMRSADVGSVPVVQDQESRKLAGIVTDRDLALNVLADGRDPATTRLEEVMSRNVVTCLEDDDLERALQLMEQAQVRRIPVVQDGGTIVGIIAQADVATRVPQPGMTAELVEQVSEPKEATGRRATGRKTTPKKRATTKKRSATKRRATKSRR